VTPYARRVVATRRARQVYPLVAGADVLLAVLGRTRERRVTKPLLMPALLPDRDATTRAALVLGGLGDVALLGASPAAFTAGLASFLAGHVAWIAALRGRPGGAPPGRAVTAAAGSAYVAAWGGLNAYLWPRTGRDRWPVAAYSTVLLAMALTALRSGDRPAAAGGALFLVSDSLLALDRFGHVRLPAHEGWVMSSYAAAQALLAAGGRRAEDG
jgi:uncharacterized membrane protein YhhN